MVEAKQYGERVNIVKYVRVEKKWRFAAVVEKQGRVIRDQVWIARRKEHHPEGRYFLEWYQGGKRRRHSVGGFENVVDGARRKAIELGAIRAGLIHPQEEPARDDENRISIDAAIDSYLDLVKHHRSLRTYRTYRYTLDTLLRKPVSPRKNVRKRSVYGPRSIMGSER
jgi:integrase/recombinase XerD